ncbi:GDSL-like Lipase/Acylhydrolase [compost metagenome]
MVGMRNNRDIQLINHLLREASLTERFTYIDMYSKLVDVAGLLHAEYTYDGLHLTVKGYEIVSDELQKYL